MTEKAAKAERSLATTCAKYGISESGKRWLDLALDPFKDLNLPTAGYPDSVTVPSVVQTIHDSYSIAVPGGVPGNWDCNIFIDSLYNSVDLYTTVQDLTQNSVFQAGQGATPYKRGGLIVRAGNANAALNTTTTVLGVSLKQDVLDQGDVRIIGMGLEIHNTTQELKKQGAIICYRVPDAPVQSRVITHLLDAAGSACISTAHEVLEMTIIPDTASATIDLPGSVQWEAKDGAYIVPVLAAPTNQPQTLKVLAPIVQTATSPWYPLMTQVGVGKVINFSADNKNLLHGFSTSGCYLTGLSNETTLQVNLTYYVEVFPKITSVLRRSVQPAPGLDARALDLYAHIIAKLPVGVEVNDNFVGAFINGIAQIARTALPFLAKHASTIGQAAGFIGNMMMNPSRPKMQREDLEIEELDSPAVRADYNDKAIVPSNGRIVSDQRVGRNEIVTQVRPAQVVRTVIHRDNRNSMQNNGPRQARTQKARAKKNDMITQATRGYAGNRWIDNPKKK